MMAIGLGRVMDADSVRSGQSSKHNTRGGVCLCHAVSDAR